MCRGGITVVTEFLSLEDLILKIDKFVGVNYVGGVIPALDETEFERILNHDHTGVADDAGAVTRLGDFLSGRSSAASAES